MEHAQHFDNLPLGLLRDPEDYEVAGLALLASYMERVQSSADVLSLACAGRRWPIAQLLQCSQDGIRVEPCLPWAEMVSCPSEHFDNIRFSCAGQADNHRRLDAVTSAACSLRSLWSLSSVDAIPVLRANRSCEIDPRQCHPPRREPRHVGP